MDIWILWKIMWIILRMLSPILLLLMSMKCSLVKLNFQWSSILFPSRLTISPVFVSGKRSLSIVSALTILEWWEYNSLWTAILLVGHKNLSLKQINSIQVLASMKEGLSKVSFIMWAMLLNGDSITTTQMLECLDMLKKKIGQKVPSYKLINLDNDTTKYWIRYAMGNALIILRFNVILMILSKLENSDAQYLDRYTIFSNLSKQIGKQNSWKNN